MRTENLNDLLQLFPDIDGYWDFQSLPQTELNIKNVVSVDPNLWSMADLGPLTQLARVQGLLGRVPEATAVLNKVREVVLKEDEKIRKVAEIRCLLEQGRLYCLSMMPSQSHLHFSRAWELAKATGDIYFSIDAAIMLSITQPPKYRNESLQEALRLAEATDDDKGKLWRPILNLMDGWHWFDFRRYDEALKSFEKALASPPTERSGLKVSAIRWAIARTLRALNRIEESLVIQKELLNECNDSGKASGYVYLELAECLQTLGKQEDSKGYFELAYKELSLNGWYSDNKSLELSRIQHLYKKK